MSDNTKIEWADATVNAINGCSLASPGCTNCYAMKQAHRVDIRRGLTQPSKGGMVWTGEVRFAEDQLLKPLAWKRPRRIFWNAHGDTFHPSVPNAWIDQIVATAAVTPQHIHMILTKRSDRMRDYFTQLPERIKTLDADPGLDFVALPLPNLWLGVSVEDQTRADERREDFRNTPAAVKFVSYEPALGPVDWSGWDFVDQIIGGGESGPKARPAHPDWFRGTRDWCATEGVAYFHKQNGEYAPGEIAGDHLDPNKRAKGLQLFDGRWIECWSEVDGHCDDEPDVYHIGKKRAGRLLDGVEHNGVPA